LKVSTNGRKLNSKASADSRITARTKRKNSVLKLPS
jgi:hypothetical protein